jgi:hypothetical protein
VAVGRWLTFADDGSGEILRFFGGAIAVSQRDGSFEIAPQVDVRFNRSQPILKLETLCFGEPTYRDGSFRLFEPNRPIPIAHRLYDPTRTAEPMTVTLLPSRRVRIPITQSFVTSNREAESESELFIKARPENSNGFFLLFNGVAAAAGRAAEPEKTVFEAY